VQAIATYTVSLMGKPSAERQQRADELRSRFDESGLPVTTADSEAVPEPEGDSAGARIYASACAICHESVRALPFGGLNFALSTAVNAPNPQNIVNVTLFGLPAADGEASAVMPDYRGVISDEGMADLLAYLRDRFSGRPAWTDLEELVRATRTGEHPVRVRPSDGIERAPENVGAED
jgi:mono/diheme cytochrome c family protein